MSLAICFIIITTIAAAIADIFKKKIDITIPIAIIAIVLVIYPFGFFQKLSLGVLVVCAISIIAICYLIIKLILSIKDKKVKEFIPRLLTPGIVVYLIFWLVFTFINKWRMLTSWDEFSHWGLIVKNMFIFDSYATNPETIVLFRGYPPFTAILEYFFLRIKNYYLEGEIIIAMNVLYISVLLPIFRNINWNKQIFKLLIYIPIIFVLPLCIYSNFYTTIYVDTILGIVMAYILYTYFNLEDDIIKYVSVCLGLIALPLIKAAGSGLTIFTLLIILVDILIQKKQHSYDKKQFKKYLIIFLVFIMCFIVGKYSWDIHLNITNTEEAWNTDKLTINNVIEFMKGNGQEYQYTVIKNFINKFIYGLIDIKIGSITNLNLLLIYILYSIYMLSFYYKTDVKRYVRCKYSVLMLIASYILYMISLLILYVFTYSEYEAVNLASYERYSFIYLLGMFAFNTFCLLDYSSKNNGKKVEIIILIIILLLITPWSKIEELTVKNKQVVEQTIETRKQYKGICKYIEKLDEGDKVYYISCGTTGYDSHISRYEMVSKKVNIEHGGFGGWSLGPSRYEGDIWSLKLSVEEFKDELLNEKYTHVYIFKADDIFKKTYGSLFKDTDIENKTMYKVNINKNKVILSELK